MDTAVIRPPLPERPLLPNEARLASPHTQAPLTRRFLLPTLEAVETCLLEVRALVDQDLQPRMPVKLGKPYPLGQCLEIAVTVQKRLGSVKPNELSVTGAQGLHAWRSFLRAGGIVRQVWGDLRGQYFQNAFQVGTLYIDVANDTVVPTKPKVEILPFEQAQFTPIRDFDHFSRVARSYWKHEIWPNHVLPELAPHCPLIHVLDGGQIKIHDATYYMLGMTRAEAFLPSERALQASPMPREVFDRAATALRAAGHALPASPEAGRAQALRACQQQRAKRWHQVRRLVRETIFETEKLNLVLAEWHLQQNERTGSMATIKIDGIDYDIDGLSNDVKNQLQMLQVTDQEIERLQARLAIAQTARNTYANSVKALLQRDAGGAA